MILFHDKLIKFKILFVRLKNSKGWIFRQKFKIYESLFASQKLLLTSLDYQEISKKGIKEIAPLFIYFVRSFVFFNLEITHKTRKIYSNVYHNVKNKSKLYK